MIVIDTGLAYLMRFPIFILVAVLCFSSAGRASSVMDQAQPEDSVLVESSFTLGPFHVDKKYPSMTGPDKRERVTVGDRITEGDRVWVKSMRLDITNTDGDREPISHLCHAWLSLDKPGQSIDPAKAGGNVIERGRNFYLEDTMNFTLSGSHREIKLPAGFAIPVDRRALNATVIAMVLNHDESAIGKNLLYTMTVQYMSDKDAAGMGIRPLKVISTFIPTVDATPERAEIPSEMICFSEYSQDMKTRSHNNTAVFYVPPGEQEFRTTLEKQGLFRDGGTIHYMGIHMHAYGRSMALVDKTESRVLWKGMVNRESGKNNASEPDEWYASAKGITINPSHDYELVGTYFNDTDITILDAMAMLRIYYAD